MPQIAFWRELQIWPKSDLTFLEMDFPWHGPWPYILFSIFCNINIINILHNATVSKSESSILENHLINRVDVFWRHHSALLKQATFTCWLHYVKFMAYTCTEASICTNSAFCFWMSRHSACDSAGRNVDAALGRYKNVCAWSLGGIQ